MITGLPQDYLDAAKAARRSPVQLAEFVLPDGTYYLSDAPVGILEGLAHDYEPWVESWGTLADNTQLSDVFAGNSLEIRSCQIVLIMSPVSASFIRELFAKGIENTKVNLYQWFHGMTSPPQLIDVFVCQDPIGFSEGSMLLTIDLVSPLMATNPHLWPTVEGIEPQPVVVGKAFDVPLVDLQTARKTGLGSDVDATEIGEWFIDNGVGFPENGFVSIDSEVMAYSWISASGINVTARAQQGSTGRPHYRGALVVPYGAVYDYAICAGPVQTVDNFKGNGEPYINPVEVFPGQNPVIARFTGRPPWLKVEPGQGGDPIIPDPVTSTEYGTATENNAGSPATVATSPASINTASGAATMAINQTVAGGAGSFSKYSLTWAGVGLVPNTSCLDIQGEQSSNGCDLRSKCCFIGGNCADGAIGSMDGAYGHDDAAYGNLTSLSVDVTFGVGSDIIQSHSKVRVIFINHLGAASTLQEWEDDGLSRVFGDTYRPAWYNKTINYVISGITTFAQLKLCKVRIELENITANTYQVYGTVEDRTTVDVTEIKWKVGYFTPAGTVVDPWQDLVSKFNRDLSANGAITNVTVKVRAAFTLTTSVCTLKIVRRSTANVADNTVLWSMTGTSSSIAATTYTFNLGTMSWAALQNLRIGIYQQITGPDTEGSVRKISTSFEYVQWVITYQPGAIPTPDEERVTYAETMTCDVTSMIGANPTPPQVVRWLIENNSQSGQYIDTADFDAAHAQYNAITYYLNGILETNIRLHDALRQVMDEGLCRLLFNQGKIRLLGYFEQQEEIIDRDISEDAILLRSRSIQNQPTSEIRNKLFVMYGRKYTENIYEGKITVEDSESIAKFQLIDFSKNLDLISTEVNAQLYADQMLRIGSRPLSVYALLTFMESLDVEKGDVVSFRSPIDKRFQAVGHVLSMSRTFGSGKLGQINTFNVQVFNPTVYAMLDLFDYLAVKDTDFQAFRTMDLVDTVALTDAGLVIVRDINLTEFLAVKESLYMELCEPNGYGACGYGVHPYGV